MDRARETVRTATLPRGVMFNAYPDSIGARLSDGLSVLDRPELRDAFSMLYVLPTFFNSDLDRGFSIIDYDLNEELVSEADLRTLQQMGLGLKLDLVLNHLSVGSPQFRDLLSRGDDSPYRSFFIDWNEFWSGEGELDATGLLQPKQTHLDRLFMRKPEPPTLKVRFPDGTERPYWNTFYQHVQVDESGQRHYLGQMDLNAESEEVWRFYDETLGKLRAYGTKMVRLDAFAYLHKKPGEPNFFNKPGTWEYLDRLRAMADAHGLTVLPEIHGEYGRGLHEEVAGQGFPIYDFFLPGLILNAVDRGDGTALVSWLREVLDKDIATVNMLGCHDGIPILDLNGKMVDDGWRDGLLPPDVLEEDVQRILERGGRVKNLYGADGRKIAYYQVNATYFGALGEDEDKLRLARALQLFAPGLPQVWYLDLFAGSNDYEAADRGGPGGHKEINRTTLDLGTVQERLDWPVVQDQLELIRLRNTSPAFYGDLTIESSSPGELSLTWRRGPHVARLRADLVATRFEVTADDESGTHTRVRSAKGA
mgnify:CR=1 FL=1